MVNDMNINFMELEKIIKIAQNSNINSLEVTDGDLRIHIVCQSDENNSNSNSNDHQRNSAGTSASSQLSTSTNSNQYESDHLNDSFKKKAVSEDLQNQILAPMLGTFYRRSEPAADEFVTAGDKIEKGQTLCIIEAMKMMHEVKAEFACIIKESLVDEGDVVDYGQPLFVIETVS